MFFFSHNLIPNEPRSHEIISSIIFQYTVLNSEYGEPPPPTVFLLVFLKMTAANSTQYILLGLF